MIRSMMRLRSGLVRSSSSFSRSPSFLSSSPTTLSSSPQLSDSYTHTLTLRPSLHARSYIAPPPSVKWQYLKMEHAIKGIRDTIEAAGNNMIVFEAFDSDENVKDHVAITKFVKEHDITIKLRVKNSEFRRALLGTELQSIVPAFQSMNGVVYPKSNDEFIGLLKLLYKAKVVVVAGVNQRAVLHPLDLKDLTEYSNFNEMLATMVGTINSQGNQLISTLGSSGNRLIRTLDQLEQSKQPAE